MEMGTAALDTKTTGRVTSERRPRYPESECPCVRREKSFGVLRVEAGATADRLQRQPQSEHGAGGQQLHVCRSRTGPAMAS